MPPNAYRRNVALNPDSEAVPARWVSVRPGLSSGITFYGVIHGEQGILVCISDRHQTRYYWFSQTKRETVIVDHPSQSFSQAIANLFRGLVVDSRGVSIALYSSTAHLFLSYFLHERVKQSFTVEGKFKSVGDNFIAELEWFPEFPYQLQVSSTMDKKQIRKVSLLSHPIAEVHKQCHR